VFVSEKLQQIVGLSGTSYVDYPETSPSGYLRRKGQLPSQTSTGEGRQQYDIHFSITFAILFQFKVY
jgi:hypothetical protein